MAEPILNTSGFIYALISGMTTNVTGADYLSVGVILLGIIVLAVLMRIPAEFILILTAPLAIVIGIMDGHLIIVAVLYLILLGLILSRNFFFR